MPRSTFVQTSSTKIPSPLSALHPANHRFFTPLFSSTSEPLFAQLLCFHIYLRCPLVFLSVYSVPARPAGGSPTSVPSVLGRSLKSFAINGLRPLVLSCLSFLLRPRLFSAACGLFLQNTGGGVCCVRIPGAPMLVRNFIFWLSTKRAVTNAIARRGMKHGFARRFVAGETLAGALTASRELCDQGRNVSLNHLGENVSTEAAAREVCASYIQMIEEMHAKNLAGNISIKLTQLGLDISKELCASLAGSIARRARDLGRTIEMDMEGSVYTDVTLDIFEAVQREHGNTGLAVQAYLHRTENDLQRLAPLKPKIRLVKGAYREPAKIAVQGKPAGDANYKHLTTLLLEGAAQGIFLPAIASHDPFMVAHAQSEVARLKLPKDRYEFQMIYGIRRDLQQEVHAAGHTLQVYVPFGTDWCPYFMRRLSERPANCWFVLRSLFAESSQARTHAAW